jgi:hypothetical protein
VAQVAVWTRCRGALWSCEKNQKDRMKTEN